MDVVGAWISNSICCAFLYVVLHAIEEAKDRKTNVFMILAVVVIFS